MLTIEQLKAAVAYDRDTGKFVWLSARNHYTIGREAGSLDSYGYRRISIGGTFYKAHRLAWMYIYGALPPSELDHINGDRDDNRITNLRLADRYINTQNISMRCGNSSGFRGVSFYRPTAKWKAQIRHRNKTTHLGYFETPEDAHAAYVSAKMHIHPGFSAPTATEPKGEQP